MARAKDPLYEASSEPELITVPELPFIAVDGTGDPNTSERFEHAVEALYGVSYGIKMSPRKGDAPEGYEDFRVGALEGLWWIEGDEPLDVTSAAGVGSKDDWSWTLMVRQPAFVTAAVVGHFRDQLKARKRDNPVIDDVRFETFAEGECVQCMHIGPYATEPKTVEKMRGFVESIGKRLVGKHHEIYLGDPRRAKPEKLRTVLRHPVA
jgi:hypothetical protein